MELKTVVVGDMEVGKTSLSSRFCHGQMPVASTPTIGASFLQKRCEHQNRVLLFRGLIIQHLAVKPSL